jgi:hypothetical protein
MEINLINALIYSIIPTVLCTLITLFLTEKVKGGVKIRFEKKLEKLKTEHSIEIAKFQAEISTLKSKENFKFTKLHEKRFEVLEKLYRYLNITISKLNTYVSPAKIVPTGEDYVENEDKLEANFQEAHREFINYFSDNRIYIGERITAIIEKYIEETNGVYFDYNEHHFMRKFGKDSNSKTFRKAAGAYKKIQEKIIPIKKEIENLFREVLEKL